MSSENPLELFVGYFDSFGYECTASDDGDYYICQHVSTNDFYIFSLDKFKAIILRNYLTPEDLSIESTVNLFLQAANEFNSNFSVAKCYASERNQMTVDMILSDSLSKDELREILNVFKHNVSKLQYKFEDICELNGVDLHNTGNVANSENSSEDELYDVNNEQTYNNEMQEETQSPIISCSVKLDVNFTIYLFEKILIEYTTDVLNDSNFEFSEDLQRLIARGLPEEDDLRELSRIFKEIVKGTCKINATEAIDFVLQVNLNNEDVVALKFSRNYAPFSNGSWQLTASNVR